MAYAHKSYARVAMQVAADKKKHPEKFCVSLGCLYRLGKGEGTQCPHHRPIKGDR
jgi:hypothetical protein